MNTNVLVLEGAATHFSFCAYGVIDPAPIQPRGHFPLNLITNAVKFGAAGTPIAIGWNSGIAANEVTVQNEGPVIPEQEIPRLFQQFRRATSKDTSTPPGWGLGLTVVKGVVDAHNGKIHVASAEGTGTRFTLEIPCAPPPGLPHA